MRFFRDLDGRTPPRTPPVWVPPSSLSNDRGRRKNTPPPHTGSSREEEGNHWEELLETLLLDLVIYGEAFIDGAGRRVDPRTVTIKRTGGNSSLTGGDNR